MVKLIIRNLMRIRNLTHIRIHIPIPIRITTISFTVAILRTAIIHFHIHIPTTTLLFTADILNTALTTVATTTSLIEAFGPSQKLSIKPHPTGCEFGRLDLAALFLSKLENLEAAVAFRTSSCLRHIARFAKFFKSPSVYRTSARWIEA